MEILTLLKANIRHKKGSFVSIIMLMIIISMSFTSIISIKDNCKTSIENALKSVDAGTLNVYILDYMLSDELINKVESHKMVERVADYPCVAAGEAEFGTNTDYNTWFLRKLTDKYKILSDDLTAYAENTPELNEGEIYIPQGICTNLGCKVGDTLKLTAIDGVYSFRIKGIVVEPVSGSANIGWKQVFVSDADFDKLYNAAAASETSDKKVTYHFMQIYKSADSKLDDKEFKRQLNLDTGIVDNSLGSLRKDQSLYYTNLVCEIVLSVLIAFVCFLVVIVLIMMGHSVSTSIEMDYVNLGVLKSQGASKQKIRIVFILQYIFAEILGSVIGLFLAVFLIDAVGNVFQPMTAILAENNISFGKSLLFVFAVMLLSGIFVSLITRKVGKISPVRAISGGKGEIYFDSRIKAPISQKSLSASLALRQFTSNKRRYTGTIIIVTILVFFMITMNVLSASFNSKSVIEATGNVFAECVLGFKQKVDDKTIENIEKTVEKYSAIDKKYYSRSEYVSINGEEFFCTVYKNPEIITMVKGRAPLYENEIVITEILATETGLNIGDEVTVSHGDEKAEYIISGFHQCGNDVGLNFSMSLAGAQRLGDVNIQTGGYSLNDPSKVDQIVEEINEEFSDVVEAVSFDYDSAMSTYNVIIDVMKAIIYVFSVVFALVVVMMVCSKTFLQERKDIGIYKALGFTSKKLRLQFAVRFLLISAIGSIIGLAFSFLFSDDVLKIVLKKVGFTGFVPNYTAGGFIVPIALICICFLFFAFFASRKIKKVEIKELVIE